MQVSRGEQSETKPWRNNDAALVTWRRSTPYASRPLTESMSGLAFHAGKVGFQSGSSETPGHVLFSGVRSVGVPKIRKMR